MALTLTEKAVFEYRLKLAKKALKARGVKYYGPALAGLPPDVRGALTPMILRNVMNAGVKNTQALVALEQLAGIESPELSPA